MRRFFKYIIFIFFVAKAIDFGSFVFGQEEAVDVLIGRPEVEYKSSQLRDPFQTYIIKEKKVQTQAQGDGSLAQKGINPDELKVQGIIWGGKMPQAIINNKVYVVGDLIDGAEILSIDKNGIKLSSAAGIFDLVAPGKSPALDDNTKDLVAMPDMSAPGMPAMTAYANNSALNNINKEEPNEKNNAN